MSHEREEAERRELEKFLMGEDSVDDRRIMAKRGTHTFFKRNWWIALTKLYLFYTNKPWNRMWQNQWCM